MINKVLFLINPISGIGKQKTVEKYIETELDESQVSVDISYTKYKAHARELAGEAVGKYDVVVAVGGDGTVNEVASKLIGTDTALAIIPTGSGNGLARFLHIPLRVKEAIQVLNNCKIEKIDSLKVNQYCCVNVAGIGFDAHISHHFEGKKLRGPLGYLQLIAMEYANYKPETYHLKIDDQLYVRKAFLVSFANSSQYGNNIHIAPQAKIDDGLIDVSIIHDFPIINAPTLILNLLEKAIDTNEYDEVVKAKQVIIEHEKEMMAHIDGEPVMLGKRATIEIKPASLQVIVPAQPPAEVSIFDPFIDPFKDLIPKLKEGMSIEQIWKTKN